jgi:hypothetical protein
MEQLRYKCRVCKKETEQLIRVITDNLPPNVKTIQCCVCSTMTVAMIGASDGDL